jgi:asparaginyl-tRNA synthetase
MAFGRVYCFGPAFRAEKSKTRRHLIEFWMMEPEWAFATLEDVIALEERLLLATIGRVLDRRREDLKVVERDVTKLERISGPFPRIHYSQAVERLHAAGHAFEWGGDFGGGDEPGVRDELPGGGEGVLHGARSGRPAPEPVV